MESKRRFKCVVSIIKTDTKKTIEKFGKHRKTNGLRLLIMGSRVRSSPNRLEKQPLTTVKRGKWFFCALYFHTPIAIPSTSSLG